jgi:hypothetical protein
MVILPEVMIDQQQSTRACEFLQQPFWRIFAEMKGV